MTVVSHNDCMVFNRGRVPLVGFDKGVNAEITFLLFKERRPFKLKNEYPSEQWQIISF
jgi:hypothetical protein